MTGGVGAPWGTKAQLRSSPGELDNMRGQEEDLGTPMDLTHCIEWEDTPTSHVLEVPEWAVLPGKWPFPGGDGDDVLVRRLRPPVARRQEPQGGAAAEEGGAPGERGPHQPPFPAGTRTVRMLNVRGLRNPEKQRAFFSTLGFLFLRCHVFARMPPTCCD